MTFLFRLTTWSIRIVCAIFLILLSTRRCIPTRRIIFTTRRRVVTLSLRRWSLTFLSTTLRTARCIRVIITILVFYNSILWRRWWNT